MPIGVRSEKIGSGRAAGCHPGSPASRPSTFWKRLASSSTFERTIKSACRKALRDRGYVVETGDLVEISDAGGEAAGWPPRITGGVAERVAMWRAALPQSAGRIFDKLRNGGGAKWIHKTRLAESLGLVPRGGHWNHAIAVLRQNALIEIEDDRLRLAAELRGA
jgi:hypothetical protein